jgi:hypothetical protein
VPSPNPKCWDRADIPAERAYALDRVAESANFKATVEAIVGRPGDTRVPRRGEVVLLGTSAAGTWARFRIQRRYGLVASLLVRGFVVQKDLDRLAIVIPDDNLEEAPRRFRVAFAERDDVHGDEEISDRRLARLVVSARRQWSRGPQAIPKPTRTVFGRPWPVAVLLVTPLAELAVAPFKVGQVLRDPDTWLPAIPAGPAFALYLAYVALAAATVVMVWRRPGVGYRLALTLSAVQVAQSLALYLPLVLLSGFQSVAFYIAWSWSRPALIWLSLFMLYLERVRQERN